MLERVVGLSKVRGNPVAVVAFHDLRSWSFEDQCIPKLELGNEDPNKLELGNEDPNKLELGNENPNELELGDEGRRNEN